MKIWGVFITVVGIALFVWHLVRVRISLNYEGYASHQVMAVDGVILVVFGAVLYFLGHWRATRRKVFRLERRSGETKGE